MAMSSSQSSSGDLDVFLSLIESRLRADFTSPDLSRAIIAAGSTSSAGGLSAALPGGESSPSKFLSLLAQVLHKPAKPIKLRALMSVLGLDSDEVIERSASSASVSGGLSFGPAAGARHPDDSDEVESKKTDAIVWQLLQDAEKDGEMWVRVVAGIIKGIMFTKTRDVDRHCDPACRGETAKQELDKITTEILKKVVEASSKASSKLQKLEQKLQSALDDDDEDDEDDEMQEQQKKQNDRFIETCQIGQDVDCTFAPDMYSLLSPSAIGQIIPEANTNCHFTCNTEARVLHIDEEVEKKRAEEEGKELHVQSTQAKSDPAGRLGGVTAGRAGANSTGGALLAGRMRGRFSSAGRAAGQTAADRGASLFRPSNNVSGRGRGLAGRGRVAGRVAGRAGTLPGRGGATAGRLHRRLPRAMLAGRGRGSSSATASSSASGESKMKMIDVSTVEELKTRDKEREQKNTVQARKLERKRKLLEEAQAVGLSRNARDTKKTRVEEVPPPNTVAAPPQQHGQQKQSPDDSWQALLSKSNQLSSNDRQAIHEFFNARKTALPIDQHDDANGEF